MVAATIESSILLIGSNFVRGVTRQLLIPPLAYATEQGVEIASEEHLESMVFHPEPLGYTDAVSG
jgi:hypothetical protein